MKNITKVRKYKNYFFSFFSPILLIGIVYFYLKIYPFGSKSILSGDLLGQYVSITNYVKANIVNQNWGKLLFSTSVGLGINFFPVLTYYVFSPLNILAFLFNRSTMPIFFELNILIDIGLIGLTAYIFLNIQFL